MKLFDRVTETRELTEKNMLDTVWPFLEYPASVENFNYREDGVHIIKKYLGRGVVCKILEDEFLNPPTTAGKIVVRGVLNIYKSGKKEVKISLYRVLGYDIFIPTGKSLSFIHSPSKNRKKELNG